MPTIDEQRQAFLDALKEDPRDEVTHKVYADWLEENGFDDEAFLHREWTLQKYYEAVEFVAEYARRLSTSDYDNEYPEYAETRMVRKSEAVLEAAHAYLDAGRLSTYRHWKTNEDTPTFDSDAHLYLSFDPPDFIYENRHKFWECFEVLTGRLVHALAKDDNFVRCSC